MEELSTSWALLLEDGTLHVGITAEIPEDALRIAVYHKLVSPGAAVIAISKTLWERVIGTLPIEDRLPALQKEGIKLKSIA